MDRVCSARNDQIGRWVITSAALGIALGLGGCGSVAARATSDAGGDASSGPGGPDGGDPPAIGDAGIDAAVCASTVDLTSDGNNCGVCGHSCGGGACLASTCQPVALAVGQNTANGIAIDAANAYWTTSDGNIMKIALRGGTPVVLATGQNTPFGIGLDNTTVYWANAVAAGAGQIMSVAIAGGAPATLADAQARPFKLVVNGGVVYWLNSNTSTIMKVPVFGGTAVQLADKQAVPADIAIDPATNTLYWTSNGGGAVRSLSLAPGATVMAFATDQDQPLNVRVHNRAVYWTDDDNGNIMAEPVGGATPVVLATGTNPTGLAIDDQFAYWTEATTVKRVPLAGGQATVIAANQSTPTDIAVDATSVYWLTSTVDGAVMKLAK